MLLVRLRIRIVGGLLMVLCRKGAISPIVPFEAFPERLDYVSILHSSLGLRNIIPNRVSHIRALTLDDRLEVTIWFVFAKGIP